MSLLKRSFSLSEKFSAPMLRIRISCPAAASAGSIFSIRPRSLSTSSILGLNRKTPGGTFKRRIIAKTSSNFQNARMSKNS